MNYNRIERIRKVFPTTKASNWTFQGIHFIFQFGTFALASSTSLSPKVYPSQKGKGLPSLICWRAIDSTAISCTSVLPTKSLLPQSKHPIPAPASLYHHPICNCKICSNKSSTVESEPLSSLPSWACPGTNPSSPHLLSHTCKSLLPPQCLNTPTDSLFEIHRKCDSDKDSWSLLYHNFLVLWRPHLHSMIQTTGPIIRVLQWQNLRSLHAGTEWLCWIPKRK